MFKCIKLLIILLLTIRCQGHNYVLLVKDDGFFKPCNGGNIKTLEINLKNEYDEDMETLVTNGNITVAVDIPKDVLLGMDLEVLSWKRGKWEKTVYSMRRNDLCSALFNPAEYWYSLTKSIPEDDRTCPPKKGTVYHFNGMKNRIELQNVNYVLPEGQYKVIVNIMVGSYSACLENVLDIWKN